VIAVQYGTVALAKVATGHLWFGATFWLLPLRALAQLPELGGFSLLLAFILGLLGAAVLAWLSFRRAHDARRGYALAALALAPTFQLPAALVLSLLPSRRGEPAGPEPGAAADAASVILGVLAGAFLIVFGVFVSAVAFGAYGAGMFILTPFLVGVTTAYIANYKALLTSGRTFSLVIWALALSAAALLLLALEGLICILMAAPLAIPMAAVGGWLGRSLARAGRTPRRPAAMSVALLPLVFAAEAALPPAVILDTHETIVINAPPARVWAALTDAADIPPPSNLLFRLGLAYPVRGELRGEGVGAERIGVFSTGEARERVTVWSPEQRLEFVVLSNPPLMDEFSPYEHVHAPHVNGYFDTAWTRFDLQPLPGGRTRLVERATHTLRLDPVLYWAPMVRWGIDRNNARVLAHIRAQAEAPLSPPTPERS
jgi:hypothetical protein